MTAAKNADNCISGAAWTVKLFYAVVQMLYIHVIERCKSSLQAGLS